MRNYILYIIFTVVSIQVLYADRYADSCAIQVQGNDTLYLSFLRDVYVYPPMKFKSKRQERFYWRTVRDVKKTLPIAKILTREMVKVDADMSKLDKKERRKYWRKKERELFRTYEDQFRHMTARQGKMLMVLIDRECGKTSFQVIEKYKGRAAAGFWQFIAKLFGNDLKEEYDGNDKDRITERIITLVEAGQL